MTISANFPNVKPSLLLDFANAQQLPPSVTFTRATTGTYYNGSTTAVAEQNLLLWSQAFDTAPWSGSGYTLTANVTTAPDGTTTAESFVPNTNSVANHQLAQNITVAANTTHTVSIYAKAFGYTKFAFRESVATGAYATFDLASSGSVISTGNIAAITNVSATITSVGSGWFRATVTFTATVASAYGMGFFALNNTYTSGDPYNAGVATGNGTDGIYIWGAQAEQRSSVSAYTATTTASITNYVPVLLTAGGGQPRFDHNPTTSESLGLLIEMQRTNLVLYSAQLDTNPWTINSSTVTITSNTVIAPDGTLTGDLLKSVGFANDFVGQIPTLATSTVATFSFYIKNVDAVISRMMARTGVTSMEVKINWSGATLTSLTIDTGTSASFAAVGNGWYRVQATYTTGETNQQVRIYPDSANTGKSAFFWGAQLEQGAFATSYIPTTSAATTRAADVVSMSGVNFSSWYSPGNGTFYAEASTASTASDVMIAEATNSAGAFLDFSLTFATTSTQFINRFVASNNDMRRSGVVAANTMVKFSGSITNSSGTTLASANGVAMTVSTNQTLQTGADRMFIGSRGGSSLFINAPIRKLAFYPAQLTQTQQNSITG